MQEIIMKVEERIYKLEKLIERLTHMIQNAPEGTLRVARGHGTVQYYHRRADTGNNGVYIRVSETELVRALAQKDYCERAVRAAGQELKRLYMIRKIDPNVLGEAYSSLSEDRKKLVRPVWLSDDEFARCWQAVTFERKPIGEDVPEYITNRGERVRSKSEILIANKLDDMKRKYHYEKPLRLKSGEIIYPDFTVLHERTRKTLYLEHFGKMGDGAYAEINMNRIDKYIDSGIYPGIQLFITHETDASPLNMRRLEALLQAWFM